MERIERVKRQIEYHNLIDAELATLQPNEKKAFIRHMVCTDVYFLMYYVLGRKDICYEEWVKGEEIASNDVALDMLRDAYGDEFDSKIKYRRENGQVFIDKGLGDYEYEENGKTIERYYRPYLFERCAEIQAHPDGFLDIHARDHYKTSIITYALTMQEILKNPEITICIYSYNVSTAQKMLSQIKNDLQSNSTLLACFPDVLFTNVNATQWTDSKGHKHKMVWSDDGFNVKRHSNPKEHTVECSGLVSGQKTGGHYNLLIYDDTVTPESVFTPTQIKKTTSQFKMSLNTGSTANMRIRMIGTRYSSDDTYSDILKEGGIKLRQYTCTEDGTENVSNSVLYTPIVLADKLSRMSGYVSASQMFCNPERVDSFKFQREWIGERVPFETINLNDYAWYIIVDPAIKVSQDADNTAMWVVGRSADKRYYLADLIRDKLNLSSKQKILFELVAKYTNGHGKPTVFYENVAMQADIQYMEEKMIDLMFRFNIIKASGKPRLTYGTTGQNTSKYKDLRIQALEPLLRAGKLVFADKAVHKNWQGENEDMLESFFTEEYDHYPLSHHDDGLDCLSRIADLETGPLISPPKVKEDEKSKKEKEKYNPFKVNGRKNFFNYFH